MLPRARTDHLVIQELAEETLVYDQRGRKAHCLNGIAARIWKGCDGKTDVTALFRDASAKRESERFAEASRNGALVQLALEQLASRSLLGTPVARGSAAQRQARRDMLKQLAAAALPVILTVTAPRANAAGSHAQTCPAGQVLCQGACLTPAAPQSACGANCNCAGGIPCSGGICCIPRFGFGCTSTSQCCPGNGCFLGPGGGGGQCAAI